MRGKKDRAGDHDDEEPVQTGEQRAQVYVHAREAIEVAVDALVHDRSLDVELHVGRDRRADERQRRDQRALLGGERRQRDAAQDRFPVRPDDDRADRVGDEREDEHEERALDDAVAEEHHEGPDRRRGGRDGNEPVDPEELEARGDARELGDDVGSVRDEQREHRDDRPAKPEALADQVRQALARDHAHAGAHLLHDDQPRRRKEEQPQQREAVVRADGRVRRDASGVVAGEAGDDPGAHDREESEERGAADTDAT